MKPIFDFDSLDGRILMSTMPATPHYIVPIVEIDISTYKAGPIQSPSISGTEIDLSQYGSSTVKTAPVVVYKPVYTPPVKVVTNSDAIHRVI